MLDEQAIRGHAVAVDDHSGVGGVGGPAHSVAVVGTPDPQVVQQDVVTIYDQTRGRLARGRAPDAEEHVVERRRICSAPLVSHLGAGIITHIPAVTAAHLQQHR